jgi:XTP/dITP diphosphohydrolase
VETFPAEIVLASANPAKAQELARLLEGLPVRVRRPADVGGLPPVVEDGATFAANAEKKAVTAARASRRWALADDSGLCVDALGGEPGVRSARYAGEGADDARNNAALLRALAGASDRSARFVCSIALADPSGEVRFRAEGSVEGKILEEPRGSGGFGYDPLFFHPPLGRTFAELPPREKDAVSHRGRALRALRAHLERLAAELGEANRRR